MCAEKSQRMDKEVDKSHKQHGRRNMEVSSIGKATFYLVFRRFWHDSMSGDTEDLFVRRKAFVAVEPRQTMVLVVGRKRC